MIKKVGKKWVLYNSTGTKILGRHDSKSEAEKQEVAIIIAKKMRARKKQLH